MAKVSRFDIFVSLVVGAFILAPASALTIAWAASTLWRWFLQPQYGAGPSYAAWYGVSALAAVVLAPSLIGLAKDEFNAEHFVLTIIMRTLTVMLAVVLCVASAGLVRAMIW